jgi:predicted dehydrogenase
MTTRRDFIRTTAVAAAAGGFIDFDAALDAPPMPRPVERIVPRDYEPVRIGIIGTGGMGTEHCRAYMRLLNAGKVDVQIVALADVCQPRLLEAYKAVTEPPPPPKQPTTASTNATETPVAEKAAAPWQVMTDVKMYSDYRQLLADRSIHGVLIAAPEQGRWRR